MNDYVFKILVGSRNYNLNDETSDYDYKKFLLPTFRQLIEGKNLNKNFISEKEDIETKSLLDLPSLLYKANPAYLELLFSQDVKFGFFKGNHGLYDKLISKNEDIVRMNLPKLYQSTLGTIGQKKKMLFNGTSGTQHLVDKYGYDSKQLLHLTRLSDLLISYADNNFTDYTRSLVYIKEDRGFMLDIKNGSIPVSDVINFADKQILKVEKLKDKYMSNEVNEILNEYIKELIFNFYYENLKKE